MHFPLWCDLAGRHHSHASRQKPACSRRRTATLTPMYGSFLTWMSCRCHGDALTPHLDRRQRIGVLSEDARRSILPDHAIRPASGYTSRVRSTLIASAKDNMASHPEHVPPAQAYRRSRLAQRLSQYVHLSRAPRYPSPRAPMPRWMRGYDCMQSIMNHVPCCMLLSSCVILAPSASR
jgi:hypothetical protein